MTTSSTRWSSPPWRIFKTGCEWRCSADRSSTIFASHRTVPFPFCGKIHDSPVVLEAVASYDLWIWQYFFRLSGSLNDIIMSCIDPLCLLDMLVGMLRLGSAKSMGMTTQWATISSTESNTKWYADCHDFDQFLGWWKKIVSTILYYHRFGKKCSRWSPNVWPRTFLDGALDFDSNQACGGRDASVASRPFFWLRPLF
jgi:hypothetical protein